MKIFVAGHNGLVGSAVVRHIAAHGRHTWCGRARHELDLSDPLAVRKFLELERPDAIVVAAAKVGGIGANSKFPLDFLQENLKLQLNLFEAADALDIDRLIFLGSSCIYPKFADQPIREESLLTGALEPTNEPYALAKIAGLRLVEAYSRQNKRDWLCAMPTNIYGPGDNFNIENGHVLPSLLNKFHTAKQLGHSKVRLWGSGTAMREFLHADDLADAIIFLLENHHSPEHINIGTGVDISIRELAESVKKIVGFEGEIEWDSSMPDGTPRKVLDVSKMEALGWVARTPLQNGLESTYTWFQSALSNGEARL